MSKSLTKYLGLCLICVCISACFSEETGVDIYSDPSAITNGTNETDDIDMTTGEIIRPTGWAEETHGRVTPNYEQLFDINTLFEESKVHELFITVDPEDFERLENNLDELFGYSDDTTGLLGEIFDDVSVSSMQAACDGLSKDDACVVGVDLDMEGTCRPWDWLGLVCFTPLSTDLLSGLYVQEQPLYVPAQVRYNDTVWHNVGLRYKGNSSLLSAIVTDNKKIPFRLHFDKFEDQNLSIRNQRFYGFQKMTFASNFRDNSQIREFITKLLFIDHAVPVSYAAMMAVYVDVGEGPEYWGLYTMIEDPADDALLDREFNNHDGNLYKPFGKGARWTEFNQAYLRKRTNEDDNDYSDVKAAMEALNAPIIDPVQWRMEFERHFNVDAFLRWLAVNTTITNWDTYGIAPHNYYIYADSDRQEQFQWITWDHNQALVAISQSADVLHKNSNEEWPLIHTLLKDDVYQTTYVNALQQSLRGFIEEDTIVPYLINLHRMITPYVIGDNGEQSTHTHIDSIADFEHSLDVLINHFRSRRAHVSDVLESMQR